ncbi:hypothetical protein BDC45DRAFT_492621 [Circinella umbellata]|nr:hypothetical protein BDC45DRAFT_492621 [Circinella umbellata]
MHIDRKQLVPVFDVLSVEGEPAMTFSTTNTIAVIDISRAQLPSARKGSLFTQSPQELLEQVFDLLSISDLVSLSQTCTYLRTSIDTLPIWSHIINNNNLKKTKKWRGVSLVAKSIWRICELCYKSCGSHGSSKALTVFKDDYQQVQKLCVNEYIETKPEVDLPRQLMTGVVNKTEGRKLFKISPDSFDSLNPVYQHTTRYGKPTYEYQLKDVARRAMIVHGGLVGVVNTSKEVKKMISDYVELYVGHLPKDVNINHLKKKFEIFGEVSNINLKDGFAFVTCSISFSDLLYFFSEKVYFNFRLYLYFLGQELFLAF